MGDRQSEGQTNGQAETNIPPPSVFVCGGYNKMIDFDLFLIEFYMIYMIYNPKSLYRKHVFCFFL